MILLDPAKRAIFSRCFNASLYSFTGILHRRTCVQHLKNVNKRTNGSVCPLAKIAAVIGKGQSAVLFFLSRINDRKCRATSTIFASLLDACSKAYLTASVVSILLEYKTLPCLLFALPIVTFPRKCFISLLPRYCAV